MSFDAATIAAWVSIIGAICALGLWLRNEIKEITKDANDRQLHSDAFEARVGKIISSALTGALEPLMRAISDVEMRQRDHGRRIGELEQAVAALRGRIQGTRGTDV